MSYVDLIIKYLSGDLSQEESRSFEEELESNAELKEAFEEQSAAYQLIRNQLQKRDQQVFKAKLAEAMSKDPQDAVPEKRFPGSRWLIPPAVACVLAILLMVFIGKPGNERLLSKYHQPSKDALVLSYYQETRGGAEPGILQYRQGNYSRAMELLSVRFSEDSNDKLIRLYYLLSAMELDRQLEVLELISQELTHPQDLLAQSIRWYSALALIKSDRREEALMSLQPLTEHEGPYQSDATKLEKVLLK